MPSIDEIAAKYVERPRPWTRATPLPPGSRGTMTSWRIWVLTVPPDGPDWIAQPSRPLTRPKPRTRASRSRGPRCESGWRWRWSATMLETDQRAAT